MNMKTTVIGGAVLIVILALGLFLIPASEKKLDVADDGYTFFEEKTQAAEITVEYPSLENEKVDATLDTIVQDYVQDFKAAVQEIGDSPVGRPYILVIEDQEVYESPTTVGVLLLVYQDFGGAHGLPQLIGLNFDKETGEEILLSDVLALVDITLEDLAGGATDYFAELLGDSFFSEGAEAVEENFSSFVVSDGEVLFYFQPYQVAAYALGPQEYKIEY
jgi:hypothetical protein